MDDIALFYMSSYKYGGFPTFTQHLCNAMCCMGYNAQVYKVRARTENKCRDFGCGVTYRNLCLDDAIDVVRNVPSLITCTEYAKDTANIDALLEAGAQVVIHDWTEMDRGFDAILKTMNICPIVIREANVGMLTKYGVQAKFIQHPYVACTPKDGRRYTKAVSLSRLDWDKNTHMIVEANEKLSPRNKIYMWGSNHNRMYLYNKILGKYDGWEGRYYTGPYYFGPFPAIPGFAVMLASNAEFVVDMSVIHGDGGGTQYCFLEAIDAGAVLILHKDWLLEGGVFEDDVNCLAVGTVKDLVDFVENLHRDECMDIVRNASAILANHSPAIVVPKYITFLEESRCKGR